MTRDLSRLFRPRSIAVIGGGAWARTVVEQLQKMGFSGDIWPVNPNANEICGLPVFRRVQDLPDAPDASFVGVNRHSTIKIVQALRDRGAGGATCFAAGFAEADTEGEGGHHLQAQLLEAAGDMPILGPNCYGIINALDGSLLWPDQHGLQRVERGVAIVTQSSNIAINLTMQKRGLPIAYMVTGGNQAQTDLAELGLGLIEDARVTALGLHVEGFDDLRGWEALSARATALGKPVVMLKVGRSEQARAATQSHTASLAGSDVGAEALIARLGFARVNSLPELVETLKLLHVTGPLASNRIAAISCSGGEASLAADTAVGRDLIFPPLNEAQETGLREALGTTVALANPLDYQTYIWRNTDRMTEAWVAMMDPSLALTLVIVDFPRADRCDPAEWLCTVEAILAAKEKTGANVAMVATLPELMPEEVTAILMQGGVATLCGLPEALAAAEAAARLGRERASHAPLLLPTPNQPSMIIPEAKAKSRLAAHGLEIPISARATSAEMAVQEACDLGFPVVLKAEGIAHKTEAGAVRLNLMTPKQVTDAAWSMASDSYLIEAMIPGKVAEISVGVVKDPAHGFVLTLAAGGTMAELWADSASLLLPVTEDDINAALSRLRIAAVLDGWRGAEKASRPAIVGAVLAIQSYVMASAAHLEEVEVNPLLCLPARAVAADALILEAP